MAQARIGAWGDDAAMTTLADWVESYLMRAHPDLGRTGAVCPFTKQAAKIDTVRLAISRAGAEDEEEAFSLIRRTFAEARRIRVSRAWSTFAPSSSAFPTAPRHPRAWRCLAAFSNP